MPGLLNAPPAVVPEAQDAVLLTDVADAHEGHGSNDWSLFGDHHNGIVAWGCDIDPGLLGAGVVVGLDLARLASRAVLDAVARDAEVSVVRADED